MFSVVLNSYIAQQASLDYHRFLLKINVLMTADLTGSVHTKFLQALRFSHFEAHWQTSAPN